MFNISCINLKIINNGYTGCGGHDLQHTGSAANGLPKA